MSSILDLNGEWDVVFDTTNSGVDQRWYANKPENTQKATVPHTWEREFGRYAGSICFYFKTFELTTEMPAKRIFLRFGKSFFHTTVWLNGRLVGENSGGHNPFLFNIAKFVQNGSNMLCVRVASEAAGRINGVPIQELPVGLPFHQRPFGGLWGDVELIDGGKACLLNVNLTPDLDNGQVHVNLQFSNPRNYKAKLLFALTRPDGATSHFVEDVALDKEDIVYRTTLQVKEPQSWSPENPRLYRLEVLLDRSYAVSTRFGFRKFDIVRGEYYFNDVPTRVQGVVYNQSHPVDGGFATAEEIRKDLLKIKEVGFNVIRSGGAPFDDTVLDVCDEIGLWVWQEFPIHNMKNSVNGFEIASNLIASLVPKQRNHPSLAAWAIGAENGTLVLNNGSKLLSQVSEHDNAHPVLSNLNCVYLDNEDNFVEDTGKVLGLTEEKYVSFNSHRINPTMNFSRELARFFSTYWEADSDPSTVEDPTLAVSHFFRDAYTRLLSDNQGGRVLVNLSFHTMLPDLDDVLSRYGKARTLENGKRLAQLNKEIQKFLDGPMQKKLWKDAADFRENANRVSLRASRERVDALMSSSQVNGYFIDCWADSNPLFNGVVDEFRRLKVDEEKLRKFCAPSRLLVTDIERIVPAGSPISAHVSLTNGSRLTDVRVEVELLDSNGKKLKSASQRFEPKGLLCPVEMPAMKTPAKPGSYSLRFSLVGERGAVLFQTTKELLALPPLKAKDVEAKFSFLDDLDDAARLQALSAKKTLIASKPALWDAAFREKVVKAVEGGATLVLSALVPHQLGAVNALGLLPEQLRLAVSTGAKTSAWHYWSRHKLFADFSDRRIGDIAFGDVLPIYSYERTEKAAVVAGCVSVTENGDLRSWDDVAEYKVGKGKVLLHQYRLLGTRASSALALALLNYI